MATPPRMKTTSWSIFLVVCQGEENMVLRICCLAQRWQSPRFFGTCITDFCFQSRRYSSKSNGRLEWMASSTDKGQTLVCTINEKQCQDQRAGLHQFAQTLPSLGRSPHDGGRLSDEVSLRLCPTHFLNTWQYCNTLPSPWYKLLLAWCGRMLK